jgi:hypothetical protein
MRLVQVSTEEYLAAEPDPVFKFSAPIAGHMNEVRGRWDAVLLALECTSLLVPAPWLL